MAGNSNLHDSSRNKQDGKNRAEYGKELLKDLSRKLTDRFGKRWSAENLRKMRTFFLVYSKIHNTVVEIDSANSLNTVDQIRNGVAEITSDNSPNAVYPIPRFASRASRSASA